MQTAAGVVGVRAFAAAASARLGRNIAPSTITRAVQSGVIPATKGPRGPLIDLSAGLAAYVANTDPVKAAATAARDGRAYDLDLLSYDAPAPAPAPAPPSSSSSMRSIKEESAALALERQKIEMAKLRGEIASIAETRTAFAKVFGLVVEQIGLGLADAAAALQEEHGVEAAAAARTLRGWWREQRAAVARAAATTARSTPLLSDATFDSDDEDARNAAGDPGTACLGGDRGDFHAAAAN